MSMTDILVTPAAQAALDALSEARPAQARAVYAAIRDIDARTGELLNIPPASRGTPFLALRSSLKGVPVVVYRRTLPGEPGDWLVVSLLSPEEFQNIRRAEGILAITPEVQEIVNAVVAGTVATDSVIARPGSASPQSGGAASTAGPDKPHPA